MFPATNFYEELLKISNDFLKFCMTFLYNVFQKANSKMLIVNESDVRTIILKEKLTCRFQNCRRQVQNQ